MSQDNASTRFYSLAACLITYEREDGEHRQRHSNIVIESPSKNITSSALNNARLALLQRFQIETGLSSSGVKDLVFLSISPLGLMTPARFHDLASEAGSEDGQKTRKN